MSLDLPTRPRSLRIGVLVVVLAGALALAGVLGWRLLAGAEEAPYTDPASTGSVTLCAADGKPVTEGSTKDRPFADIVLGETPLPEGADPDGAVATLFAYQPREGVGANEFSGAPITAAAPLASPRQTASRVTGESWSLGDFVAAFPARFDGYVQLRLVAGTSELGTLTQSYDTADIRVEGDRWHLVRGGDASCSDAADALAGGS